MWSFKGACSIHAKYISDKVTPFNLWILFFSYSLICGVIFFEFVIPNILSFHAPDSSLTPDSTYFNQVAIKLADDITRHGWQFWKLYPAVGASGQSSYLAILYVFFGAHPVYAVPFNAFFHAFSGVLIYLIVLEILGANHFSKYAAFLSASLFVIFPSSMTWVGQIHKEACLSAGFLLALWGITRILSNKDRVHGVIGILSALTFSLILVASMKPYMLQILAIVTLIVIMLQCIRIFPLCLFSFGCLAIYFLTTISLFLLINTHSESSWLSGESYVQRGADDSYSWQQTDYLPQVIDRKIQAIASSRVSLISSGLAINANSMIDVDIKPASAVEVFEYLPRALQISVLAPFPNAWFEGGSMVNFVSSMEMLICYLAFFGLLFFFVFRTFNHTMLLCLVFSIVPLVVFGISSPNIGTIYRIRYTFEMIAVMLGICGWALMINKLKLGKDEK